MSLIDGIKLFLSPAFLIEKAFTLWAGGGGGGGTTSTVTTNMPTYAKPYFQELLKQTGNAIFETDAKGNVTGVKEMPVYGGERIAGFTPEQQALQESIFNMQAPGGIAAGQGTLGGAAGSAADMTQAGIAKALSYQPGQYNVGNVSAGPQAGGEMTAAQGTYDPKLTMYQMQQARDVAAPQLRDYLMQAATSSYRPNLTAFQMEGPERVAAERASSEFFTPGAADYYMSPYQQRVTDVAVREAQRQANLEKQERAMGSIGRGTFGGARQALIQAERDRGTAQLLSDIQAKGGQAAYESAQKQFEADQARRMQAQQLNVQSGLQAMLANQQAQQTAARENLQARMATQQLDTETNRQMALANLNNEQQARVQNLASQLQTQGLSADQALKAALANQQNTFQTAQQNLQAALSVQNLGTETGRQMALANLSNRQQANVQNLAAKLQTQGLNAETSLKAALANQQTQVQMAQLMEQANQFAAATGKDIGIAGMNQQIEAGKAQVAAAAQEQASALERMKAQAATAEEKQQLEQQILDLKYNTFMEQENYQRSMLEYYSNILRGNANALGSTQVNYAQGPSAASQIGGLGLAGIGLANVFNR